MSQDNKTDKDKYFYGQFTPEHLKAVAKGVTLFNERKFWECHEELEDHWLEDIADNGRYVYWAIIQVAASLYHLREGNMAGARGMLKKAQDKIIQCEKRKVNTELVYKFLSWEQFSKLIMEISPDNAQVKDFDRLYAFRFTDPENWGS